MKSKSPKKKLVAADEAPKKKSVFDHAKHIRQTRNPDYYTELSDDDKKTFNHFMILRILSMDENLVEDMAFLYKYLDKIPSPQFYQLLIGIVPKDYGYYPWVKFRVMKHNKELLSYISKRFQISTYQANDYVNILLMDNAGQEELNNILKAFGLEDKELEALYEARKYE